MWEEDESHPHTWAGSGEPTRGEPLMRAWQECRWEPRVGSEVRAELYLLESDGIPVELGRVGSPILMRLLMRLGMG